MNDSIFLIFGVFGLLVICLLFYTFTKKPIKDDSNIQQEQQPINIENVQQQAPVQQRGIGRMNIRNRRQPLQQQQQLEVSDSEDSDSNSNSINSSEDEDEQNNNNFAPVTPASTSSGKKIGKKKLEKLRYKEEKKKAREYQEHLREEKKKNELEREEALKKKREEDKEAEIEKKEEDDRIRLEKERKEDEEYNLLKNQMTLDDSGETKQDEDIEKSLLQLFINYLQQHKICLLEDIAMEFNIKTNDVIDRIKTLDKQGLISGVIDDRGKFIYITREEMEAVAKFVNKRGRVNIEQIALESNRLIDLTSKIIDSEDSEN